MKNLKSQNIIQFVDIQQTPNNIYIFQQLAQGGNLSQHLKKIKQNGKLQQKIAVKFIFGLLNGFSQLIKHGIIHRDIKPSNILMKGQTVKIADFGLSRYSGGFSSMDSIVGTPVYMAPQVLKNCWEKCRYTYKCDIWSFGIMCYQMMAGQLPWKNINKLQFKQLYKSVKQQSNSGIKFPIDVTVSKNYLDFVQGCLKFQQENRFDWTQVFSHPLLQGIFKGLNLKKQSRIQQNYTLTQLRMKVHFNNINLQKFLSKMPQNLSQQDLFNLLKILDDQITQKQSNKIFKLCSKNQKNIETNYLLQCLQKHGIKLKGFKNQDTQIIKIQNTINKISQQIQSANIDLLTTLKKYQANGKKLIQKDDFSQIMKIILPQVTNQQIDQLFKYLNTQNMKGIKINLLYARICKIVQIPAAKDQHINQQVRQIEGRKVK